MPTKRLCIVNCASFGSEAEIIAASAGFGDVGVASYPSRCGRPPLTWDELRSAVSTSEQYDAIHLYGGRCLMHLGPPPADLACCRITQFEYCMEMIAGNHTVSNLVTKGAYLVTPGWLEQWQQHIAEWGFVAETAREFFAESSRQIVLLDTGIRANTTAEMTAFTTFVDRPFTIMPIGLDLMRLRMDLSREQWRHTCANKAEHQAQRQFTDYAMAFDLLSTLVRSVDEREVILQTINLYQTLFAAIDTAFICFEDGLPVSVVWGGFGQHDDTSAVMHETADLRNDYVLLPSGTGFLLKVHYGERILGVVRITGIAFPEYLDTYLSLALTTIDVCGMALVNAKIFREIADKNRELEHAHALLKNTHLQMLEQEKMASIGQLAAGVAHEINNPIGFITSNLGTLGKYLARIIDYCVVSDRALAKTDTCEKDEVAAARARLKIDYIFNDIQQLIAESMDGAVRVKNIVDGLKSLARTDKQEMILADLNKVLESALSIANNEIKYVADVTRLLGLLPPVLCNPQQLSQVFINLLTNAAQAMEGHGVITIRSWCENASVFVSVADTGTGIPDTIRNHIFEPFFTTKDVGKGTGLGLSISYDILQKHCGEITVESNVNGGSIFIVRLPASQL
jgi:signal transduction histidine kinase